MHGIQNGVLAIQKVFKYDIKVHHQRYYFCSEGCKQKFDKEPAKYAAPDENGQAPQSAKDLVCGMTVKPAEARFKSEYRGKTYYFCSESCKRKFDGDPARYAGK